MMLPTLRNGAPFIALIATVALAGCAPHTVVTPAYGAVPGGLTVSGSGQAKAAPDIARTNVGVEVRADSVEQATLQSNQRMDAILSALRGLGIADKDLRTHSFSISFEQLPVPPPQPLPVEPEPRGKLGAAGGAPATAPAAAQPEVVRGFYRASNMVEVTIRDLGKAGQVLQAATSAGANNVWGLTFEIEDPKPLMEKARAEAVADAKKNAQTLASLAGIQLGAIVSISEGGLQPGPTPPMYAMKAMDAAGGDVPVERGEITITQQVQLVYALPEK